MSMINLFDLHMTQMSVNNINEEFHRRTRYIHFGQFDIIEI